MENGSQKADNNIITDFSSDYFSLNNKRSSTM